MEPHRKCPTCGRAFRKKAKPKSDYERTLTKTRSFLNRELRKPMPSATHYK